MGEKAGVDFPNETERKRSAVFQQGQTVLIMFLHVPAAWLSMRRRFRRAIEDVKGAVTLSSSAAPQTLLTEFVAAARAAAAICLQAGPLADGEALGHTLAQRLLAAGAAVEDAAAALAAVAVPALGLLLHLVLPRTGGAIVPNFALGGLYPSANCHGTSNIGGSGPVLRIRQNSSGL